eukprot:6717125-Prymnesium_polylepis.2
MATFTNRVARQATTNASGLVPVHVAPVRLGRGCGEAPIAVAHHQACGCGIRVADDPGRTNSATVRAAHRGRASFTSNTIGCPHFRLAFTYAAGNTCNAPLVRLRVADWAKAAWAVSRRAFKAPNSAAAAPGAVGLLVWFIAALAAAGAVGQSHATVTARSMTSQSSSLLATELQCDNEGALSPDKHPHVVLSTADITDSWRPFIILPGRSAHGAVEDGRKLPGIGSAGQRVIDLDLVDIAGSKVQATHLVYDCATAKLVAAVTCNDTSRYAVLVNASLAEDTSIGSTCSYGAARSRIPTADKRRGTRTSVLPALIAWASVSKDLEGKRSHVWSARISDACTMRQEAGRATSGPCISALDRAHTKR